MQNDSGAAYDPANDGWYQETVPTFLTLVGPVWRKDGDSGTSYGLLAEPKHANHRGIVHGGMIMTLADYAVGMAGALATGNIAQVTIQIDVQFVSAAEIGDFIVSRSEVVRRTSSLLFLRGELSVGSRPVATANGIWKIVKPR